MENFEEDQLKNIFPSGDSPKKLGEGSEKKIFIHPNNPDLAVAVYNQDEKETTERLKARYYLTNILNLLFPSNILRYNFVSNDPHILIRKSVDFDSTDKVDSTDWEGGNCGFHPDFKFNESTISPGNLGISLDPYDDNYRIDKSGNWIYLDTVDPWSVDLQRIVKHYNPEKLKEIILQLTNTKDKNMALQYLECLEELYSQINNQ